MKYLYLLGLSALFLTFAACGAGNKTTADIAAGDSIETAENFASGASNDYWNRACRKALTIDDFRIEIVKRARKKHAAAHEIVEKYQRNDGGGDLKSTVDDHFNDKIKTYEARFNTSIADGLPELRDQRKSQINQCIYGIVPAGGISKYEEAALAYINVDAMNLRALLMPCSLFDGPDYNYMWAHVECLTDEGKINNAGKIFP